MKKILFLSLFLSAAVWAVPPKVANPLENSVVVSNELQILVYPTPYDIEKKYSLYLEFYNKNDSSKVIDKVLLPPAKTFDYKMDISSWTNGAYYVTAVYVNSNQTAETVSVTKNFTINRR